jgi:uncharacterized protein YgiM (DUF1202 family)
MNNLRKVISLMLVVLCMASFSVTAFASGGDEAQTETDADIASVDNSDETANAEEVPYSYTVGEDGSMVITINGIETEEVTTGKVVTNGGRLNLRTGAGMSYEIIDQLRCGEEVVVIGSEGDWYEVIVPEKTGFVHSDYLELLETAQQNSDIDSALLAMIMQFMSQSVDGERDGDSGNAFTPNGNMTLIDDFFQIEAEATENSPQKDKQFITLQSKNGNTFYLVIDRSGEEENVYFMNLVDEADLMALIEESEDGTEAPACSCTEKCAVGAINTTCEVCRTNMSECAGKESVAEPEPTEPAETPDEEKSSASFLPILLLLIIGGAGGAFYWFKIRKLKVKTSGDSDLDDYDYGQDDDDDEETEIDDADLMAESEEDR